MLIPIPIDKRPFKIIHLNHLGPFRKSTRRHTVVLVSVDNFTKYVKLRSYASTETKSVLRFLDEFINPFGHSKHVITDRRTCYTSIRFEQYTVIQEASGIFWISRSAHRPTARWVEFPGS